MTETPSRNVNAGRDASAAVRPGHKLSYPENSGYLRSRVLKRSIVVGRHKTSVSLEDVFWNELRRIAQELGVHLSELVARIDADRQHGNLSSAIRLFVFEERCKHSEPKYHQEAQSA
jgi:predicted DNA-binding ribbon-helix-helix protein